MKKSLPLVALAAMTAFEGASAAHAASTAAKSKASATSTTKKYKGPVEDMRWGPVQAVIYVKNKKITRVNINVTPETNRSQFIDENAIPTLQQETLQAQNANIDEVSGATQTSDAYIASLQSAVKKAQKAKLLKVVK